MKRCYLILAVDVALLLVIVVLTGCSMKQWYPTMGAVVGGGAGALGGPGIAAVGAGSGALVGEVLQGNDRRTDPRGCFGTRPTRDGQAREWFRRIYELYKKDSNRGSLYSRMLFMHPNFRSPKNRRDLF